jgi:cytochrome P450
MFDSQLLLEISVVGIVLYTLVLVVYRLYLSPVAHIPGPKLAALTHLYEGYYDVFGHQGRFLWKCKELHDRYGPIVRIGPEEVHIQDADFYSEIYANAARKRDKYPFYIWPVRTVSDKYGNHAAFFTVDHDLHRRRRNILNHFFSKKNIHDLEGRVCGKIRRLEMRLRESIGTGRPVDLLSAFSALTMGML